MITTPSTQNKLFDIRADLISKVIPLGREIASDALYKLFKHIRSWDKKLTPEVKKILISAIYVGSCKPDNPEEHRIPVLGYSCEIDFDKPKKKEASAILLLAESFRGASENFSSKEYRPTANTTAFMLMVLNDNWEEYNIPISCAAWYGDAFVGMFWIQYLESMYIQPY